MKFVPCNIFSVPLNQNVRVFILQFWSAIDHRPAQKGYKLEKGGSLEHTLLRLSSLRQTLKEPRAGAANSPLKRDLGGIYSCSPHIYKQISI